MAAVPAHRSKVAPDPVAVLRGHTSDVQALAFLPCGLLLAGDADGTVKLWDPSTRRATHTARAHGASSGVLGVGPVPGAHDALLTQGRDGTLKRWQLLSDGRLSAQPTAQLSTDAFNFCRFASAAVATQEAEGDAAGTCDPPAPSAATSPAGRVLVALAGSDPAALEVWDLDNGVRVDTFGPPPALEAAAHGALGVRSGMALCVSAHVRCGVLYLLAGYEDGSIRLWDSRRGSTPLLTERMHQDPLLALALDSRGRRGASGAADAQIVQFTLDIAAGRCARGAAHAAHAAAAGSCARGTAALSFRSEGRLLAAATWDGRVRLFDAKAAAPLASLRYHTAAATALAWAEDAKGTLASGARDGCVALWELYPPAQTRDVRSEG